MTMNAVDWHDSRCACGHITLRLGMIRMEFTKEQIADLHKLVGEAMSEFQIVPTEKLLAGIHTTRH